MDPLSVKDGFIEVSNFKGRYVFGSLATYHCNPGYILWGNASRLCAENGKWTGNFLKIIHVDITSCIIFLVTNYVRIFKACF